MKNFLTLKTLASFLHPIQYTVCPEENGADLHLLEKDPHNLHFFEFLFAPLQSVYIERSKDFSFVVVRM